MHSTWRKETNAAHTHHLQHRLDYNVYTNRAASQLTNYHPFYTPKFPGHIVGVPYAGGFVRFKTLLYSEYSEYSEYI